MHLMPRALASVVVTMAMFGGVTAAYATGRLVYLGTDPSCHFVQPGTQGIALTQNVVTWVGGGSNPNIAVVGGSCVSSLLLAAAGFTNVTVIPSANLASTNLSAFAMLWVGVTLNVSDLVSAAANVQNFVDAGGGLALEAEIVDAASWTWAPFGNLIGSSGPTNLCNTLLDAETVTIVDPAHPVMSGLSDAGLSNWTCSVHSDFSTPQAAGFVTLTVDSTNTAQIIARAASARVIPPAPAPALSGLALAILGGLLLCCGLYMLPRSIRTA